MNFNVQEIEAKIGYTFNNKTLLEQAFTRSSYSAEHSLSEDNEVMEFIGDSIVGAVIVKHITSRYSYMFERAEVEKNEIKCIKSFFISEYDESELSSLKIQLVQRSSLAAATARLGLERYLIMGKGDIAESVQEQDSVKEDLFEAIVGAVAIDSGWNMPLLESLVLSLTDVDNILENGADGEPDYEQKLADWFIKNERELVYEEESPISEELKYGVSVNLGANMLNYDAYGYGATEKGAKRMAAKRAMAFIDKVGNRIAVVLKTVGFPMPDRAVNQLQELYQKGIISEPKYEFEEFGCSDDGNPNWHCECSIKGAKEPNGGYICHSKKDAKKAAAYDALLYLLGRDMSYMFSEHGEIIDENKNIKEEM